MINLLLDYLKKKRKEIERIWKHYIARLTHQLLSASKISIKPFCSLELRVGKQNNIEKWAFSKWICFASYNKILAPIQFEFILFSLDGVAKQIVELPLPVTFLKKCISLCEDGFTAYVLLQVHKSNYAFFSLEEIERCLAINGRTETCGISARH